MAGGTYRGTLIVDDAHAGGSDDGAWHTHIAHTPRLRAQVPDEFPPVVDAARAASIPVHSEGARHGR